MFPCCAESESLGRQGESGVLILLARTNEEIGDVFGIGNVHHQGIGIKLGGPVGVLPGVVTAVEWVGALDAAPCVMVRASQVLCALDELQDSAGCLAILLIACQLIEAPPVDAELAVAGEARPLYGGAPVLVEAAGQEAVGR